MSDFTPKTRLEKILCGVVTTARTRLEKAVKYAVEHAGGGGGGTLIVDATLSDDQETHLPIISTGVTAGDLYEAITDGKTIEIHAEIPDNDGAIPIVICLPIACRKYGSEGESVWYEFSFAGGDLRDGAATYVSRELVENDLVTFLQLAGN